MSAPEILLEVSVASERDVPGAQEGGASRLHAVGPGSSAGTLSPEPATVMVVPPCAFQPGLPVEATRVVCAIGWAGTRAATGPGRGEIAIGAPSASDWIRPVRIGGADGMSGRLPVAAGSLAMFDANGLVKGLSRRDASDEQAAAPLPITPMRAKRDSVFILRPVPRTRIDAPVCLTQLDEPMKAGFRLNNRSRSPRSRPREHHFALRIAA